MSHQAKSCYLKSNDKSFLTVYLPDREPVLLGRCPETNIIDTECSRQQVRLCADYTEYKVTVQQIGKRACGFNGFKTSRNIRFVGQHNDHLEMLYGKYDYQIEFNPPPAITSLSKKRSYESEISKEIDRETSKVTRLAGNESNQVDKKEKPKEFGKQEEKKMKNSRSILNYMDSKNKPQTSADTKNNVNSSSTKTNENIWDSKENGKLLIYTAAGSCGRSKIAAYDMDGTLIKTKSGHVFPKDCDDWQLLYTDVPGKLKKLHADGYKIVVFTNQAGIGAGKIKVDLFKSKIMNVVQKLGVPMQVFIATGDSIYRKPSIGMWQALHDYNNDSVPIDKANSFYIGDAAGRPRNWAPGKVKDHSLADRLLAINLGVQFQTPEEHFLGHKPAPFALPEFNPRNLPTHGEICTGGEADSQNQEMVLMVGCPASGKSHFVKNYMASYERVNRDTLGSWQKCVSVVEKHIRERKSVVIDNTNPDRSSRQRFIDVAKKYNLSVRCFVLSISVHHIKHNNKFRELTDPNHSKISEIIINSYMKNYQPPTLDEGFRSIVQVNFVPKFETEKERELYQMYLRDR